MDPNIPVQPAVQQEPQPVQIPSQSSSKVKWIILALAIVLLIVGIGGGAYFLNKNQSQKQVNQNPNGTVGNSQNSENNSLNGAPFQTTAPTITPISVPFPNFSKYPSIPATNFDTTKWKEFDDPTIGLKFLYPPEWGNPQITTVKTGVESYPQKGMEYYINFDNGNAPFSIGAMSSNYQSGARSGLWTDFNGINDTPYGFKSVTDLCNFFDQTLYCRQTGNEIQVLAFYYNSYIRLLYINRPGKEVSGIVLGGGFISQSLAGSNNQNLISWFNNPNYIEKFNKAILQRKLDASSMKNLDAIEKVFETIQTY